MNYLMTLVCTPDYTITAHGQIDNLSYRIEIRGHYFTLSAHGTEIPIRKLKQISQSGFVPMTGTVDVRGTSLSINRYFNAEFVCAGAVEGVTMYEYALSH